MIIDIKNMKLKMWKKVEMPEKIRNDKGGFDKTGKMTEMTGYTLHDQFGEELYFVSPHNQFRDLEGKNVNVQIKGSYSDYDRKNKFVLGSLVSAE